MNQIELHESLISKGTYESVHSWPNDYAPQCGNGLDYTFGNQRTHTKAFFEAFPVTEIYGKKYNPWIRGEGNTVAEAEEKCWQWLQKVLTCQHNMKRGTRTDGYAYCENCKIGEMCFEPLTLCEVCKTPTRFSRSTDDKHWCENHVAECRPELMTEPMLFHLKNRIAETK